MAKLFHVHIAILSQYLRKVTTTVMSNTECQSVYGTNAVTVSDICSRGTNFIGICSVSTVPDIDMYCLSPLFFY